MILSVDIPFDFFQIVFLMTDMDQLPRMVVGVKVCPYGYTLVELQAGTVISLHYIGEISDQKNLVLNT